MGDVNSNTRTRKRRLSKDESLIEISDGEACLENSSESLDVEIVEPSAKVQHLDKASSQNSDFNLEFVSLPSTISSTDGITQNEDLRQKLLQLDDEIKQLKIENEELKSRTCLCRKLQSSDDELVACISFNNADSFRLYKDTLTHFFRNSLEFSVNEDESGLVIRLFKECNINADEWVVIDESEVSNSPKKSRKKKKKSKLKTEEEEDNLFVLDTTPSTGTKNNLQYESKFTVLHSTNADKTEQREEKPASKPICFNCNESHMLRDCPKRKDYSRINTARQKFKTGALRYHLENDQKYAHLQPGKISEKLQHALGLYRNQLPAYIYKMRQLGYPPGWLPEMYETQQVDLMLFDFEGKGASVQKKHNYPVDPDRVIEYPGFNVPMGKGVKDEYRLYGCPSYSKEVSKESMLEFLCNMMKKVEDNLEACDMDIDNVPSDKEAEQKPNNVQKDNTAVTKDTSSSPTLVELESEKEKLLAELSEDKDSSVPNEEIKLNENTTSEGFKTIDCTGIVDTIETIPDGEQISENANTNCNHSLSISSVKASNFGTPIIKSATPYNRLPEPEKFSLNISQVINFENLPNSTGKYEQMTTVLEKVRKTLKHLNEQKS